MLRTVDRDVSYSKVSASRGKVARAEPIAALFEQGRAHLVGLMPELSDQLCSYVPGDPGSPDRMDAMVWGMTELSESASVLCGPGGSDGRSLADFDSRGGGLGDFDRGFDER